MQIWNTWCVWWIQIQKTDQREQHKLHDSYGRYSFRSRWTQTWSCNWREHLWSSECASDCINKRLQDLHSFFNCSLWWWLIPKASNSNWCNPLAKDNIWCVKGLQRAYGWILHVKVRPWFQISAISRNHIEWKICFQWNNRLFDRDFLPCLRK